ncbi:unnamed protein product, partial [Brassica oleracea]
MPIGPLTLSYGFVIAFPDIRYIKLSFAVDLLLLRHGTRSHLLWVLPLSGFLTARSTRFAVSCAFRLPCWLFRHLHLMFCPSSAIFIEGASQ